MLRNPGGACGNESVPVYELCAGGLCTAAAVESLIIDEVAEEGVIDGFFSSANLPHATTTSALKKTTFAKAIFVLALLRHFVVAKSKHPKAIQ